VYTTCIFCHGSLGANEVIEHFPVGRRLAFDGEKGRLWVVCRRCERWNLTPLEERWEAIEECERAFRATVLRASTDNIGLARLRDGTDLVRIGRPLRPELAAWRYGDQFGRRRRRMITVSGLGVAVMGCLIVGGTVAGVGALGVVAAIDRGLRARKRESLTNPVAVITDPDGIVERVTPAMLTRARLAWFGKSWALELPTGYSLTTLEGTDAMRAAAHLLPAVNRTGGSSRTTREAVALLEQHRHPEALFRAIASEWDGTAMGYRDLPDGRIEFVADSPRGYLTRLSPVRRLALEMAAHEDAERRAVEGELRELEAAWRNAEEIAAIADNLLL
jgi:hypothetical protein